MSRRYTVIRGGRVLDGAGRNGDFADILIDGDTIRTIGPAGLSASDDALVVDASDRLLMPGLVNAHTHGDVSFAKGLGDKWTLELLLNANPLTSERFRLEDKYLAAKLAAAEMVLAGCTACYDLFSEFPVPSADGLAAVGRAYAEIGIRAVVAPLMADRSFWQAIPGLIEAMPEALRARIGPATTDAADAAIDSCRRALKKWRLDRDHVRLALAPTIPYHCADDFFRSCRRLADEYGVGIHSHLAESKVQAVVGRRKFGMSLARHLDSLGVIGPDFTAAHAVWVDADDIALLADRGATVAHNPTSNLRLGVGAAPVKAMLDAGLGVGVGTDAATCSDSLNMFEAMRLACYLSRIHSPDPAQWLGAEDALRLATEGSAKALGFGDRIGRLAPGFKADLVFLNLGRIAYVPFNHAARQVVFQENGASVDSVMIGGAFVVRDGRPVTFNLAKLRAEVEQTIGRIRAETAESLALVQALEPVVSRFCVGLSREPFHVHRYVGEAPRTH